MITKAQVKHIQSLEDKKYRSQQGLFVVEGEKMVEELLNTTWTVETIYAVQDWITQHHTTLNKTIGLVEVSDSELQRISALSTPNKVLALVRIPGPNIGTAPPIAIVLDGIQDPGNLGSIIRIADWYAVPRIYCSPNSADAFNRKVIQASMGSLFRTEIVYTDLQTLLLENKHIPAYACVLNGKDVNTFERIDKGFIIVGNESKGIREELISASAHQISIKRKGHAESLNAAIAAGIVCHCLLS